MKFKGLHFLGFQIIGFFVLLLLKPWQTYNHKIIQWDISIYYTYLPATFIYNDVGIQQDWPVNLQEYQLYLTRNFDGKEILKMSSGMAYLYAPWFFGAHAFATAHPEYAADGFSLPYHVALACGAVFWVATGLFFLYLFLRRFVSVWAALICLGILLFGTNLFYYTFWDGAYSHSGLFALFCIFLEVGERYIHRKRFIHIVVLGFLAGLIVLIRPILAMHIFALGLFYLIRLRGQIKMLHVALAVATGVLVWLPQMAYWHFVTGDWFYYSYGKEGFFWSDSKIIDGLFSWRKGWLIYTPIMALVFPGFYVLYKKQKSWFWLILILFVAHVYVIFSWWCWWYGGSYGQRPMIELYPFLALPLALLLQSILQKRWFVKVPVLLLIVTLSAYNLFTTKQYMLGFLHYDSMSKETYELLFLEMRWPDGYEQSLQHPDYEAAMLGNRDKVLE